MKYIDMHCDTLSVVARHEGKGGDMYDIPYTAIDFKRMKEGQALAQFFAIFTPPREFMEKDGMENWSDDEYVETLSASLHRNVEKYHDIIAMAYNAEDILNNEKSGKMSAVLTMEEGRMVDGSLEKLKHYYDMGVRALSLTWNYANCFGSPNSKDETIMNTGLTPFGKEAVVYMQELGMLVDVSHLSDGGFWDCIHILKKPFVATHSDSRSVQYHSRNLTDEMIRALADKGGVSGINFCPMFLNGKDDSKVADMARHARHMANVGGMDFVALGSDLDGIRGDLEIDSCEKIQLLVDALKKEKFTEAEIEKIFYKNVLRVMKDAMK